MKKSLVGILIICMGFILYGCSKNTEIENIEVNNDVIDKKSNYTVTEVFEEATTGNCEMEIDNLNNKEGYYIFHGKKKGSNLNIIRNNNDFVNQEVTNTKGLVLYLKKGDVVKMKNTNFSILKDIE